MQRHAVALIMSMPAERLLPFVSGTGLLADSGDARGPLAIFESMNHAAAIGAVAGDMALHVRASEDAPESGLFATVTFPSGNAGEAPAFFVAPGSGSRTGL